MREQFLPEYLSKQLRIKGFNEPCLGKFTKYNFNDNVELYPESQNFFKG